MSSYVTRRLLRSTLPGPKAVEEKPKDAKSKSKADRGSRSRDDRRKKARREVAKAEEAAEEPAPTQESEESGASALTGFGLMIDVNYADGLWAQARVLDLNAAKKEAFVHYMGWNARYDAWVGPELVAPHGSRTKCAAKKKTSWDGKRSLFAPMNGEEPAQAETPSEGSSRRRSSTPKAKNDKRKRRGSTGSRDGATPMSPAGKREDESAVVESPSEQAVAPAPPVNKSVPEPVEEAQDDAVCEDEEMAPAPSTNEPTGRVLRRQAAGKRRGRGRKGQEEESSESEYSNHEDSDAEQEDDASDEEEVRRLRKRRRQKELGLAVSDEDEDDEEEEEASDDTVKTKRSTTRRSVRTKTHPLPQSAPRIPMGGGGATREHLAAIFRQRVFQQQLMQVTRAELQGQPPSADATASPVAPTPAAAPSTERTRSRRSGGQNSRKAKAAAAAVAAASVPAVGPDPQLAAYYHYHNMMVAQAYMSADPKEIQERMRAIDQQRMLQVQAYYRHLEAARAQNVQSIEDAQEFMAKSASAWQQQSQAAAGKTDDEKTASEEDVDSLKDKQLENGKTGSDSPRDATAQDLVDASGAGKTRKKEGVDGTCQADAAKEPIGEPDAPRGDILYEFVL